MVVYTARIEVDDNASLADIADAQLSAKWTVENKETKADRMRKTPLAGKCGSCRWFSACPTWKAKSYGDCKNMDAPITVRWGRSRTQTCKKYESRGGKRG